MWTAILRGILCLMLMGTPLTAGAQEPAPVPAAPPEVQQLIDLLRQPEVQAWLAQGAAAPAAEAPAAAPVTGVEEVRLNIAREFRLRGAKLRAHMASIRSNIGNIPAELGRIGRLVGAEVREEGLWRILFLSASLLVLGYGLQRGYWTATRSWRKQVLAMPLDTVEQRLRVVGLRFGYNLLWIASFAVGSLGALLLFAWPPLLKTLLSAVFVIIIVTALWSALTRFLLSPHNERLRVYPVSDAAAAHWHRWGAILMSWLFGGWVVLQVLRDFDMDRAVRLPIAYGLGLVLLGLALWALWHRPALAETDAKRRERAKAVTIGVTILFAVLWLLWVAGAMPLFWVAFVAAAMPTAVQVVDRSIDHILTPPGTPDSKGPPSVLAAAIERGARALMIILSILVLAWGWGIDLDTLTASDTAVTRFLRGLLNAVIILMVADFAWHVIRAVIDRHVHDAQQLPEEDADATELSRRSRIRTLLPILRNILFIVFLVMAVLMALSAMGVQIAPLIAGAGVVGVAVGFGAQTLVKDVISGIFYLLDDAFRVGEYIISGSYKGTVESFSLRSIKLRHHRGYLYTVPFGSLGAVQNMSRDWVIEKIKLNVPFDTDLDKMKRLVKQVGKELMANPDLADDILQPLKMQGVDAVGDFAFQVTLKMMTKPGQQFTVRRRAYAMLAKTLAENGIRLAFPTVQVAGGDDEAAAAQAGLAATAKASAA